MLKFQVSFFFPDFGTLGASLNLCHDTGNKKVGTFNFSVGVAKSVRYCGFLSSTIKLNNWNCNFYRHVASVIYQVIYMCSLFVRHFKPAKQVCLLFMCGESEIYRNKLNFLIMQLVCDRTVMYIQFCQTLKPIISLIISCIYSKVIKTCALETQCPVGEMYLMGVCHTHQ